MRKVECLERFELSHRRRDRTGELVGSESQRLKVGERRNRRRNWTVERVISEVKNRKLGEFRNERRESAGVTGGVESDLGDPSGVRTARKTAGEVGPARESAWVGGEVPGS